MNLRQRRKAAFDLLMQPLTLDPNMTIEQKVERIKERRAQVMLVYYFMSIAERHVADQWLAVSPRTSDPEFNPVQGEGPTLESSNHGRNQELPNHGFQPRKRTFRR